MPTIWTLGPPGKRTRFAYTGSAEQGVTLHFKQDVEVSAALFDAILSEFRGKTVLGGFNMTAPAPGSLGWWVHEYSGVINPLRLSARHASFIAAILVHEGHVRRSLLRNAVYLHFDDPRTRRKLL